MRAGFPGARSFSLISGESHRSKPPIRSTSITLVSVQSLTPGCARIDLQTCEFSLSVTFCLTGALEDQRLIAIHLNGETKEIPEDLSLAALLEWLKLPGDRVAVERNLQIVPRREWDRTRIESGDKLEVVHFVGGGSDYLARSQSHRHATFDQFGLSGSR